MKIFFIFLLLISLVIIFPGRDKTSIAKIFLHTKHITVDGNVAVVGSSNLDIRSFELDLEVSMVLYDAFVVKKLRVIEKRYTERSKRLSLSTWKKRSLRLQALDSIARLTASLQ